MEELFYILVGLQILAGLYALWEGVRWLQMVRRRLATYSGFYAPRVAVICPCKGLEPGLEQNLTALTDFDYSGYEVFFGIAASTDSAHEVLRRVVSKSKPKARIVIAGKAEGCSDKVNNLRAVVEQLPREFEVMVFVDSDGRPPRSWLQRLVAPLADSRLGATTTFRWYLPDKGGFWSAFGAAWNAPVATFLGEHSHNFCWGGGTAIRRSVFDQAGALQYWSGSASDDYSLTHALRAASRPIHFLPECLVPTLHDFDFDSLMRFTNRQIIITRVYEPKVWAIAGAAHLLYCGTFFIGLGVVLGNWLTGYTSLQFFLLLLTPLLLAALKGALRQLAVTDLLPAWRQKLHAYGWAWTLLAPLVPFLYLVNTVAAAFTRRIVWRGVRYELVSPSETRILR